MNNRNHYFIEKIFRTFRHFYFLTKTHNKKITIISNDCSAGIIYGYYGLQFLSPTIGLYFRTNFLSFANNLDDYLSGEMFDITTIDDINPVGELIPNDKSLPSVKISFIHYKTFEEAKNKWIERAKRVCFDSIYIVLNGSLYPQIIDELCLKSFYNLNYHKIYFYNPVNHLFNLDENQPFLFPLRFRKLSDKWFEYNSFFNILRGKRYLFQFNFVKWLSGKKI